MKLKTFSSIFALNLFISFPAICQPNIVLILLDDARAQDFSYMPNFQNQIVSKGVSLPNYYVSTSNCCPSRATTLRGQYAHTTDVRSNSYPSGGWQRFSEQGFENSNIATWLSTAGYQTALFGKYLNGFPDDNNPNYVPPGWNKFFATYGKMYYNYTINSNGIIFNKGNLEADYQPSVISSTAVDWIKTQSQNNNPFFAYITPNSPHPSSGGEPPYYSSSAYLSKFDTYFTSTIVPRTPAFNSDVSNKSISIKEKSPLTQSDIDFLDNFHRDRLRSIQTVDEMILLIVQTLADYNQLDNTFIFVTSDNGFFLGEYRILPSKNLTYDISTKVSAFVRGPRITRNSINYNIVGNTDLAPTFAKIANATIPDYIPDGRSILSLLRDNVLIPRKAFLLEDWKNPNFDAEFRSAAFVTKDYKFIQYYTGERELYDLTADPYEINNLASVYNTDSYYLYLSSLQACQGDVCKELENNPPPKF